MLLTADREVWNQRGLATSPALRSVAERAIDRLYASVERPAPSLKIWVASPMEGLVIAAWLARLCGPAMTMLRQAAVKQVLRAPLKRDRRHAGDPLQLWGLREVSEVRAAVFGALEQGLTHRSGAPALERRLESARVAVLRFASDSGAPELRAALDDMHELGARPDASELAAALRTCGHGQHDADVLSRLALVPGAGEDTRILGLASLAESAGYWWTFDRVAVLSERQCAIRRDRAGRLHARGRAAIEYPDGWGYSAFQGVPLPEALYHAPADLIPADILAAPHRGRVAMLEAIPTADLMAVLSTVVIHRARDQRLLRASVPGHDPILAVEVTCPSTGKRHLLRVPPTVRSCQEAVAWTFRLTAERYRTLIET